MKFLKTIFIISLLIALSCTNGDWSGSKTVNAFYFWERTFSLDTSDMTYLHELEIQKIYIRLFDIRWDRYKKKTFITPMINIINNPDLSSFEVVPVIFIMPEVIQTATKNKLRQFALKIFQKVNRIMMKHSIADVREFQIDCDWRPSFKEKYFYFLNELEKIIKEADPEINLSATIRIFQLIYKKTAGVPPVSIGMLMPYNLSPVHKYSPVNSIMDLKLLKKYFRNVSMYPVSLDIVLPVFSWAAHFDPDKRFIGLIKNIRNEDIRTNKAFIQQKSGLYKINKETTLSDIKLLEDDTLRIDEVTFKDCLKMVKFLKKKRKYFMKNDHYTVSIFYYNRRIIERFTHGERKKIKKLY
ncbi:MAG: hypothetical protein KKH98_08290 [Spirochaetes bacterium]|nr:hypothetical protein [Spirochaetota bacterium]